MDINKKKYLYDIVFSTLKQEILDGVFEYDSMLPSEREISLRFDVDRTTVRKALQMLVDENLVEKKAGLGTQVIFKRYEGTVEPAQDKRNVIGFFMTDDKNVSHRITQPYYADLFYYLEIECKANGCQLMYSTLDETSNITEILQSQNFLSAVFVTQVEDRFIEQARQMNMPILLVNDKHHGLTTITYDNTEGAYMAVKYLVEMGHKNIAIISGPNQYMTTQDKFAGCFKALFESNIPLRRENIDEGDWEFQGGYDCAKKIFSGREKEDMPTALFVFNDMMCIGAMKALRDMSLSIPEDVSVIGFDNMEQLRYTEPELTTVDSNIAYTAKVVVESAVQNKFNNIGNGIKITVPVELVLRNTVKKINN